MITPIIEKLILKGEGTFRTSPIFGSATAKIAVPKDRFIVITSLLIYPANMVAIPAESLVSNTQLDRYSILQIDMFCKGISRNTLLIKNNWSVPANYASGEAHIMNAPPVTVDLLQLAQHDVYFSVLRFQGVQGATNLLYGPLVNSQIPAQPTSYGMTADTMLELSTQDGAQIQQNGDLETSIASGARYRPNATVDANGGALVPKVVLNDDQNSNHYIMNVFYVEFNIKTLKNFSN